MVDTVQGLATKNYPSPSHARVLLGSHLYSSRSNSAILDDFITRAIATDLSHTKPAGRPARCICGNQIRLAAIMPQVLSAECCCMGQILIFILLGATTLWID